MMKRILISLLRDRTRPGQFCPLILVLLIVSGFGSVAGSSRIKAGIARVNITNMEAGPANDSLYVKALVLDDGSGKVAIITVDAVAIAEIGTIRNNYLANVRTALGKEPGIKPSDIIINASHCHGKVCADVEQRTVNAVRMASAKMMEVRIGSGTGFENRIMENRRVSLKNGKEADSRRAYPFPPDADVAGIGPVDPEIGILRIDRKDGKPFALIYNFACHPIQGVPEGWNTSDITGFASRLIEEFMGEGTMALFIQGFAGDINPVIYKDVNNPPDAEPLGNLLAISTIKAMKKIRTSPDAVLKVINETIELPRASLGPHIDSLQTLQLKLIQSLKGTNINLKNFVSLINKYDFSDEYPSYYSHRYLHEKMTGRNGLEKMDAENRNNIRAYMKNIYIMEQLTRNQINIDLLKMHNAQNLASGSKTVSAEVAGIRIGDFCMISFPGEPCVRIGLNIKEKSPHELTFVSGCTNGYLYYAPTSDQLRNIGGAQEDSDCILAPEWQKIFETKALEILNRL
jgi:hypothetical protein